MSESKKSKNIFKRIAKRFSDVKQELKRVIWPTRQKLIQTSIIVLVVIGVFTILLTGIKKGAGFILEEVGFYNQNIETSETTVLPVETESSETILTTEVSESVADTEPTA
jgi:preprotein translocase subunit SecE